MNSTNDVNAILSQLQSQGNWTFDEEAIQKEYQADNSNKSGLAIKILSIFGGVLATGSFLGFLAISGAFESDAAMLIVGIILVLVALFANKFYHQLAIDTAAITAFISGLTLMAIGLSSMHVEDEFISLLFIAIALGALTFTQNYILSFVSAIVINGAIIRLLALVENHNIVHFYLAAMTLLFSFWILKEAKIISLNPKISKLYSPIRIALLLSLLFSFISVGKRDLVDISYRYIWISSLFTIPAVLYFLHHLLKILEVKETSNLIGIYFVSILILAATAFSPAISGSLLVILLSFWANYKTGYIAGIIAFLYFLGQYYYDLNFTLLVKSGILFVSGLLFLVLYFLLSKRISKHASL